MKDYGVVSEYLPHKAPMILLDRIFYVNEGDAACGVEVVQGSVLTPFLNSEGHLPIWFAMEMMAQTIGIWSGWHSKNKGLKPQLGMLLGMRTFASEKAYFAQGSSLCIKASKLFQDERLGSFSCVIECSGGGETSARINVYQPNKNELQKLFNPQVRG